MVKVVFLGFESTFRLPPCICIICLDKLNPMPDPFSFVVKKGIKILSSNSVVIPGPLSVTEMKTLLSVLISLLSIILPPG